MKGNSYYLITHSIYQRIFTSCALICILCLLNTKLDGQSKKDNISKQAVFVEFMGTTPYIYNISYDRAIYMHGDHRLTVGAGFQAKALLGIENTASLQLNYLYGKTHFLETGIAHSYSLGDKIPSALSLRFGYRYQRKNSLFFRIGITPFVVFKRDWFSIPIIKDHIYIIPWGGVALGYSF